MKIMNLLKIVKIMVGVLIVISFQSCELFISQVCKDEEFNFQRTENKTNKLMLSGYYYENIKIENANGSIVKTIFINENGTLSEGESLLFEDAKNGKYPVTNSSFSDNCKSCWGIYKIINNNIEIQRWTPSLSCVKVATINGIILNDTTFVNIRFKQEDKELILNDTLRFKQFKPKPDSIVSFIK
jgi:hypothetical protein